MTLRYLLIGFLIAVVLYVVSLGPALFIIARLDRSGLMPWNRIRPVTEVVTIIYYPHLYAMALSETYFDYVLWCVALSGQPVHGNHADFRQQLLGSSAP